MWSMIRAQTKGVPDSGSVLLDEEDITELPMYQRARKGLNYLPQEPSIFRKLSVEENIWAILETRGDITQEQKRSKLEELLEDLGISAVRRQ